MRSHTIAPPANGEVETFVEPSAEQLARAAAEVDPRFHDHDPDDPAVVELKRLAARWRARELTETSS
jgi:hypothetical protein